MRLRRRFDGRPKRRDILLHYYVFMYIMYIMYPNIGAG